MSELIQNTDSEFGAASGASPVSKTRPNGGHYRFCMECSVIAKRRVMHPKKDPCPGPQALIRPVTLEKTPRRAKERIPASQVESLSDDSSPTPTVANPMNPKPPDGPAAPMTSPNPNPSHQATTTARRERSTTWKQVLLKSVGLGIGIGLGLAICVGVYAWYASRPVPQKPWDSSAITASFLLADTAREDNHLRFLYILENHTEMDYRVKTSDLLLSAVVQEKDSLTGSAHVKFQDDSIFLPTKQHVEVEIELPAYHFPGERHPNTTPDERKKYREAVKKYVSDNLPRLNGFAAFDDANRYRINFPNGWSSTP